MEKSANQILELVLDRVKKYGPPAAAIGGGIAGLSHIIAMKQQHDKEVEAKTKNDNTLYIDLPKSASMFDTPSTAQYFLDGPVATGTALAAGALGYKVVNSILQTVRKRKMNDELSRTKKEYSSLLSQKIYGQDSRDKVAEELPYQNIEALALSVYDFSAPVEMDKEALSDPTMGSMMTSLPGVGALITGILAHNYWYNKQKDIEVGIQKQEAEGQKRTPAMIKLRTVSEEEPKVAGIIEDLMISRMASPDSKSEKLNKAKPKNDREIYSPSNTQQVDDNTVVISTEDGDTQVDAEDPEAALMLQKYKEIIAKSLATGVNMNSKPVADDHENKE